MGTFIFDLDGTVYRDNAVLPGARETIAALREGGHRVLFASNNSTQTYSTYERTLEKMGITIEPDGLITSARATGDYLRKLPEPPRSVLIVGAAALAEELAAAGLEARMDGAPPVDAVVIGLDRNFTYDRLAAAQAAVLAGARLIATNRDPQFPSHGGLTPGCGAMVAAVEAATLVTAVTVGKPEPHMYRTLIETTHADPHTTVVVGDSMRTDIAAATPLGLYSVLVLTGVSAAPAADTHPQPSLVLPSVAGLIPALQRARPDIMNG